MSEAISCLVRVGDNVKKNRLIKLDREQITVGRSGDVNYAILSNMISRCHAVFKKQEDDKWSVTDNKSLNGVFVNGRQLTPFKSCIMEDGDMVQFGVPTAPGLPAEFLYKFHASLKVRVEKKSCKRLKGDQSDSVDASVTSAGSQFDSSDDERKRKTPLVGCSGRSQTTDQRLNNAVDISSKEVEYQAKLAHMEKLLQEKELKQSEVEKQLVKERQERENQIKEVEELKIKEQTILMEMQDKQARLEKEKEELKQKMQAELEANLKEKEETLMSRLEDQKQKLLEEKKMVEKSLQAEMAKALEEKNKEVEKRLIGMKENLEKVIEKTDNEQKILELELNQTKEENECAKLEALKAREDVLSNFVDLMEMELQCTICNELFIKATALNCAHVFCKLCINQWMKVKKECPNCRMKITSHMQTIALDSYIEKMVEQLSDNQKKSRKVLLEQRKVDQDKFDCPVAGPSNSGARNNRGRGRNRRGNRGGNARGRGALLVHTRAQLASSIAASAAVANSVTTATATPISNTAVLTTAIAATTATTVSTTSGVGTSDTVMGNASTTDNPAIIVSDNDDSALDSENEDEDEDEDEEERERMFFYRRSRRHRWSDSDHDSNDNEHEEDDSSIDGDPYVYYCRYGRCFECGSSGHGADGCPF